MINIEYIVSKNLVFIDLLCSEYLNCMASIRGSNPTRDSCLAPCRDPTNLRLSIKHVYIGKFIWMKNNVLNICVLI